MSSKIDGVPRELLERLHEIICGDGHHEEGELGNLLDAPVVERHQHEWDINEHGTATVCSICGIRSSDVVVERQPVAMAVPDECPHLIVFDDNDRENMLFAGTGARSAALKTWEKISASWNAHLFVRIERNCRDDRYPSAHPAPPELAELAELQAKGPDPSSWPSLKAAYDEAQATIARLTAENERLKSESFEELYNAVIDERDALAERLKGAPVLFVAVESIEDPECVGMHATRKANDLQHVPLYASQPEPVSVVLPERKEYPDAPAQESYDDIHSCGEVYGWNACLDKVKELNQ